MTDKKIIGLTKPIDNAASGTRPTHHVLLRYVVMPPQGVTMVQFGSFMTAQTTQPVGTVDVQLKGEPTGSQAVYEAVLAMTDGPLAGAAPVYAEEPAP